MKGQCFISVASLSLILVGTAKAAVILSDDFTYPDGPLVTVSAGKWKTHSGTTGQVEVVSGQVKLSQSSSEDVHALLEGEPYSVTNATALYVALQVSFSKLPAGAGGTYFAHFKDASATAGFRCRVYATTNGAATGSSFRLGIAAAANNPSELLPMDLNLGASYRAVCRMNLSDNTSTLWLNPNAEGDPSVTSTDTATPKTVSAFALRQSSGSGVGMGDLTVDNVRVATTFAELSSGPVASPTTLSISLESASKVRLRWVATPDQTYTVLQAASMSADFVPIATGLRFPDGQGQHADMAASDSPARFYRVCSP